MTWIAVGVGTSSAISGVQYLSSRNRRKKDEANRPEYTVPEEVGQGLRKAQSDALYGLPDAQKRQAEESFRANQAYSLGQSSSRKGGLANVAALNRNAGQFTSNMAAQDSMARERKQQNVYGQLQNVANYEDQAFQYNVSSPYYEGIASREADAGALAQNLNKSVQLGTSALSGTTPSAVEAPVAKSAPTGYQAPSYQGAGTSYANQQVVNASPGFGATGVPSTPNPYASQQEFNANPSYGAGGYYNI